MSRKRHWILLLGFLLGAGAGLLHAQSTSFSNDLYIRSVFRLIFGDASTSDIYLQKTAANVLGISGNIGGGGAVANTTVTPLGPFAWGTVTLAANTATVTFSKAFLSAPVCQVTDQTTPQLVKAAPTPTTVVITDTVGATDVVAWFCVGNPN